MARLKCIDFFCGGGGMSQGLSRARIKIVGALDNDPECKETYQANHSGTKFILADITQTKVEILEEELKIRKNDDKLLFVGCSPCQYWSVITGREDSERKDKARPSRNLLDNFLEFVKYYRPGYVMIENVVGIRRNEQESGLARLRSFLSNNGYGEPDEQIMEASRYGVPQSRRRYVLVASRVRAGLKIPKPSPEKATVRQHIGEGQVLPMQAGELPSEDLPLHRSSRLNDDNIQRLKITPQGGTRDSWADGDLQIPAYQNKPISFFRENYGRMWWDRPAPTITTKFYSIGCGRFGHPDTKQHRAISLLEGALLQTFPKTYKFKTKTFRATGKLIGNAVPPRLAQHLGKALARHASGKK